MAGGNATIDEASDPAALAAEAVRSGFDRHQVAFREITRRAPVRQRQRDWLGMQRDAAERLDLHGREVGRTVSEVEARLGGATRNRRTWARMKAAYRDLIVGRADSELAQTFFNSVTRRVFTTVGVDPEIEYLGSDFEPPATSADDAYRTYRWPGSTEMLIRQILLDRPIGVPYQDLDRDARLIARAIEARCADGSGRPAVEAVDALHAVFYRNKGAYVIGRLQRRGGPVVPLVIALVNDDHRIVADAVLLTEDDASVVFSFTRSAFHADVPSPRGVIDFLKSIMPAKRVAELYIAIGYYKHGKAELYRDLVEHLGRSTDRFVVAPGDPGMVMLVFTLPSYDVVFKVIRDSFAVPKTVSHRQVRERYQLVFKHDRAGRLVDAQEFEHLALPRHRFSEALLAELAEVATRAVVLDGDRVVFTHVYTERRVTPLNLYLRQAAPAAAREVVLDHGRAIRDLAATNIFPGDLLLKNFGVTRHGRVIFYDYDELCLLTDCNFRAMPAARTDEEELSAEPWFAVAPGDVFPEEFIAFLGLYGELREAFLEAHADLLAPEFWKRMQSLQRQGEVVDIFPYRPGCRLRATPTGGGRRGAGGEDPIHPAHPTRPTAPDDAESGGR